MGNWYVPPIEGEITKEEIKGMSDKIHFWDFEPLFEFKTMGYDDVLDDLKSYNQKMYDEADDTRKEEIVQEIIAIYRSVNLFPITYYSHEGMLNEIEKCRNYDATFNGNTVSCGAGIGTGICKQLFPNIFDTPSAHDLDKKDAETQYKKFLNDEYLARAIKFCFSYKDGVPTPVNVEGGLRLIGSAPSNFRPMNAKAIYERFTPEGGTIWDYCAGFGGRMLGALSSKKNFKYVATDPNTETMYHLHELAELIEEVTGREDSYELHCCGSEVFKGKPNSIDFAFSSPPYFDLEVYSDEPTQCFNKFPELEGWLEGYVRQTIKNLYYMLKPGACYAVNIADFTVHGGKEVSYVDAWREISEQEGMPLYTTFYLGVTARAGSAEQSSGELKKEAIMVFKKPE